MRKPQDANWSFIAPWGAWDLIWIPNNTLTIIRIDRDKASTEYILEVYQPKFMSSPNGLDMNYCGAVLLALLQTTGGSWQHILLAFWAGFQQQRRGILALDYCRVMRSHDVPSMTDGPDIELYIARGDWVRLASRGSALPFPGAWWGDDGETPSSLPSPCWDTSTKPIQKPLLHSNSLLLLSPNLSNLKETD